MVSLMLPLDSLSQISYGESPYNWEFISKKDIGICGEYVQAPDLKEIIFEDSINSLVKSSSYRFGVEIDIEFNNDNAGVFHYLPNGDRIWYLPIRSKGALALSVRFSEFDLLPGAKVFLWDQHKDSFLGAFTHKNNKPWGTLATGLINSDRIVIEVYEPKKTIGYNKYALDQLIYAYRSILSFGKDRANNGPFGDSGECNVNVSCPDGIGWENEASAVALAVHGGTVPCTGVMVNNTNEDGIPYILTAEHCLNSNLNDWVFYFNYQSEECNGDTGPTNQTVSGSTLTSSQEDADMALLLLSQIPPASYQVCYSGWDNSDINNVSAAIGIHHPNGDLKKLCVENDGLSQIQWQGAQTWQCDDWDVGVTEIGSSGSPLFNEDHQIIGTLSGGEAFCSGNQDNGQPDWYGRFGVAWDGNSPETRLKDWLDPSMSGISSINTFCPNSITYTLDAQIIDIQNFPETICSTDPFNPVAVLKNNGQLALNQIDLAYIYNSNDTSYVNWSGELLPGEITEFILPSFTPQVGTNTINIEALSINTGMLDENLNNNSFFESSTLSIGSIEMNVALLTDDFGYETYWEIRNESGEVLINGGNSDMGVSGAGDQNATPDDLGAYENNTWYYESLQIPESECYIFEIADDFGDGICCDFGQGQYQLTDLQGSILAEGGVFGTNEITTNFMETGPTAVADFKDFDFNIFPNPVNNILYINMEQEFFISDISVYNSLGEIVYRSSNLNSRSLTINTASFASGVFTIQVIANGILSQKKVVKY